MAPWVEVMWEANINSFRPLGYHLVNYYFPLNGSLVGMENENSLICLFSPFSQLSPIMMKTEKLFNNCFIRNHWMLL